MISGVQKVARRKTNYSTKTFGAATPSYEPFSLNPGFPPPNQNADGLPEACTGYAQTFLCAAEDKVQYKPLFTYQKTLQESGTQMGQPCDIYDSLKSTIVYGVQAENETTDAEALKHKRGQYFQLECEQGLDWFDSALAVMKATGRAISIASPWFSEFENPKMGIMPETFPLSWPVGVPGHNHVIYGLTQVNGELVLMGQSWQGMNFGTHGEHYWSRIAFNELMGIRGSAAFTLAQYDGTPLTVQYGILYTLQILIRYYLRFVLK